MNKSKKINCTSSFLGGIFTIVGTMIGAGFASGQEIATFFGRWGLLPFLVATIIFAITFGAGMFLFLMVGRSHSNTQNLNAFLFGKAAPVFNFAIHFCHFVVLASMIAGLRSAISLFAPKYVFLLLVVFAIACLFFGFGAIVRLNSLLQPLLVVVLVAVCSLLIAQNKPQENPTASFAGMLPLTTTTLLYSSSNLLSTSPVLLPLGKGAKHNFWLTVLVCVCMTAMLVLIFVAISCGGLVKAELPLLVGAKTISPVLGTLCAICLVIATFSTLLACGHALVLYFEKPIPNKLTRVLVIVLSALLASRFGFSAIVKYAYPAMGVLGIVLIICILWKLGKQKRKKANET